MDYETVRAAFFVTPEGIETPAVMRSAGPARALRDAIEPVAMHAVWSRSVHWMLAGHGLDFFSGYVWGRASSLGDPTGAVVAATFAAFEPAMIAGVYDTGHVAVPRDTLVADLDRAVGASLRHILSGAAATDGGAEPVLEPVPEPVPEADVVDVVEALRRTVDAADGTGKALFAGVRAIGWPEDPYTGLWRGTLALREFRGDAHVAVYVAAGFDAVQMNMLTELWAGYPLGAYSGSRAWGPERTATALDELRSAGLLDGDTLTDAGRRVRDDLEAATDRVCRPLVDGLGDRFASVVERTAQWGARCIVAGAFPPDVRKLACG